MISLDTASDKSNKFDTITTENELQSTDNPPTTHLVCTSRIFLRFQAGKGSREADLVNDSSSSDESQGQLDREIRYKYEV